MPAELLTVLFGLAAAACWGTGDFCGGLATKRNAVLGVVVVSQFSGVLLLAVLALLLGQPLPATNTLLVAAVAGMIGTIGLMSLYHGLATGRMGVVAPVAALLSAVVPVIAGALLEGPPGIQQLAGFGLAVIAVWFISRTGDGASIQLRELGLPVIAGLSFGIFLVIIERISQNSVLWPLVSSRSASTIMLLVIAAFTRQRAYPSRDSLALAALVGVFDTGGNALYALSAQVGRLDIAAILSSLFPAVTVLLARFVLKEEIGQRQWIGIVAALVAIVLIAT